MKLNELGKKVLENGGGNKLAIITDSNVAKYYLSDCEASLKEEGFSVFSFVIPAGEESKNGKTYLELLEKLASIPLTREDAVIALGGGVVGDLAGFVAATYMRGIRVFQVPTTLLSAVDSSVGGKTGIDLESGKNLVGAFHMPAFVLQDTSLLKTLPDDVFKDGCAEIIKYAVISGEELFNELSENVLSRSMTETEEGIERLSSVISKCVEIKKDIVSQDQKDGGIRKVLNLGHTLGHAIEQLSEYKISHGSAVSKGLSRMAGIAAENGYSSEDTAKRIKELLQAYGFDLSIPYSVDELYNAIKLDKKRSGESIDLIIPEEIGKCKIEKISLDELRKML